MRLPSWSVLLLCSFFVLIGCGKSADSGGSGAGGSGTIHGRIAGADGKPITVAQDYALHVRGVSEAGEKVSYSPAVKADGTYVQKVVPGSYRIERATVKVPVGGTPYDFPLEPVGNLWNKSRDAADGIEQDYVWRVTGKKPDVDGDPNNHTHWYGMSIGMTFSIYREDLKQPSQAPPAGTKLVFTLKPVSACVDGSALQPITLERTFDPGRTTPNDRLNDLPPADYEISGEAKYPDGSTHKLLMQGLGDYPAFKPTIQAKLGLDKLTGGLFVLLASWVAE